MGTFGEIVEPGSRTTWEDWDDLSTENDIKALKWKQPLQIPESIDTLYILEGKFLADCIKMQPKEHLKLINSIVDINAYMFQLKSCAQIVFIIKDYDLLLSSEIVELLRPMIYKCTDVITIQTKPLIEYQTTNTSIQSCIIRQLSTSILSNKHENFKYSNLEQPNILSGISAGVICMREHLNLPATALVFYMEHIEQFQTDELQRLLEKLEIIQKSNIIVNSILTSNLYI